LNIEGNMPLTQSIQSPVDVAVGMGQAVFAAEPQRLTTILGSCVAVSLYSPRRRAGMLSHVVLPKSRDNNDNPAKYADTAIPYMISTLRCEGIGLKDLTAKITGGACMFGNGQISRIGDCNIQAVIQALESAGIGIVGRDAGGNGGRRISFDLATGVITVASVGQPPRTI
jgi:chemotaxis protein CheD